MKKLFTIVCTLVLGGTLAFAQAGGGSKGSDAQNPPADKAGTTSKKATKSGKKGHKGGKKSKKSSSATTTPAPK